MTLLELTSVKYIYLVPGERERTQNYFNVIFWDNGYSKGESWSTANSSNHIAGRPKAALLFWFFSDFKCGVLLFLFLLLYINIEIGKNRCKVLDWPVATGMENCCSPGCRWCCL